jgi:hypothetical protein
MTIKNFCILPFIHLATTTEGNCRLCCKVSKFDTINKPDGTPYNVNTDDIGEIWNSDHYKQIRQRVLANEQLPECKTCWREEETFYSEWTKDREDELPSKRRKENQKWVHREKTKLSEDIKTILHAPKIRYYDIRLSNLCNLKCRMCWPHFSSQIVKEQRQFAESGLPTHYKKYDVAEWDTEQLWNGINKNLLDIEEITFVGGEPTLHDEIYNLLDRLVQQKLSDNIRLKITTNLTNIQSRFLALFPYFKNIVINGSIDAVGITNDYIRYPSNWSIIDRNIDKLLDLRDTNMSLTLTPVIQIYNTFNLDDMIHWYVEKWQKDHVIKSSFTLDLDLLYDPDYLSVRLLGPYGKKCWHDQVFTPTIQYLDNIINNIPDYNQDIQNSWRMLNDLRKRVVNIALYMEVLEFDENGRLEQSVNISSDERKCKQLIEYTTQLDNHRNQNINDIIPDFVHMLE